MEEVIRGVIERYRKVSENQLRPKTYSLDPISSFLHNHSNMDDDTHLSLRDKNHTHFRSDRLSGK